jgi:hypothetical protein
LEAMQKVLLEGVGQFDDFNPAITLPTNTMVSTAYI